MLLAIDAGNSRIKWASWQDSCWTNHNAAATGTSLEDLRAAAQDADHCVVGCVAPAAVREQIEHQLDGLEVTWAQATDEACGVTNLYEPPHALGVDRWCSLLALHERCGHGAVALAGTAVTVDTLDQDGIFRGGLILPGRRLMHDALAAATSLRPDEPTLQDVLPKPTSTKTAVLAGCLRAVAGALVTHLQDQGATKQPLLIAGGDAPALCRLLPHAQLVPDLVFDGLRLAQTRI